MSSYAGLLVEGVLVFGGMVAFYLWQRRDIQRTQDRLKAEEAAKKVDPKET